MAEEKYNMKNPAVKRIMQEVKEMQNNLSDDYMSLPLEDNIFEWQFAIRGPRDTEFEGGIYHGRIQLPSEYPLKPPAFMLLTPNGRFETQTKICLSISNYHPEHWQPSWSVRSALVALIAFMPTKPEGAVGSLDYPKEERIALAVKSRAYPPKFGNEDRQKLINEIHEYMLEKSSPLNQNAPANDNEAKDQPPNSTEECEIHSSTTENLYVREHDGARTTEHVEEVRASADPMEVTQGSQLHSEQSHQHNNIDRNIQNVRKSSSTRRPKPADDRGFNMIAACLVVAIVALLLKRFLKAYWWINV